MKIKSLTLVGLMISLAAEAQLNSYGGVLDLNALDQFQTNNSCFRVSQIRGQTQYTQFKSNLSSLKSDYDEEMRMTKVRMCGTFDKFDGLQGFLTSQTQSLELDPIGRMFNCEDWQVPSGQHIAKIQLHYNDSGLKRLKFFSDKGLTFQRGSYSSADRSVIYRFDEYDPLVGFAGYEATTIKALGLYKYKCALPPSDEESAGGGTNLDGSTGEGEGEGDQTSEDTAGQEEGSSNDNGSIFDDQENSVITPNGDKNDSTLLIVSITLTLALGLFAVVACLLWFLYCRKRKIGDRQTELSKQNAADDADLIDEEVFDGSKPMRRGSQKNPFEPVNQTTDHNNKGEDDLEDVQVLHGSSRNKPLRMTLAAEASKPGQFVPSGNAQKSKSIMPGIPGIHAQTYANGFFVPPQRFRENSFYGKKIPSDAELKKMMKGLSTRQKKNLLREVQEARDMEIKMQYAVANQKLKFDEDWAVRNAEEEMRIRELYGDISQQNRKTKQSQNGSGFIGQNVATRQYAQHYRDDSAANPALIQQSSENQHNDTTLSPDNSARAMDPSTGHAPIQQATDDSEQDIQVLQADDSNNDNLGILEDESGEEEDPSYIGTDSFAQSLAEASQRQRLRAGTFKPKAPPKNSGL